MDDEKQLMNNLLKILTSLAYGVVLFSVGVLIYSVYGDSIKASLEKPPMIKSAPSLPDEEWDKVENGIHVQTGLVYAEGFDLVRGTCTACHSAKLVTQNRATREGWQQMIQWMQETQGLWDLGASETKILDYLATYYAPEAIGRRANIDLNEVEWYILDLDAKK